MIKKLFYLSLLSIAICGCKPELEPNTEFTNINQGQSIPAFTVLEVDLDSNLGINQAQQVYFGTQGRKFIYFFMSSCSDCQRQTPVIMALWQDVRYQYQDVDFLCIARGDANSTFEEAKTYWTEAGASVVRGIPPLYYDKDRAAFNLFARSTVPRFYVTNSDGVVVWQGEGVISEKSDLLRYIGMGQ